MSPRLHPRAAQVVPRMRDLRAKNWQRLADFLNSMAVQQVYKTAALTN